MLGRYLSPDKVTKVVKLTGAIEKIPYKNNQPKVFPIH